MTKTNLKKLVDESGLSKFTKMTIENLNNFEISEKDGWGVDTQGRFYIQISGLQLLHYDKNGNLKNVESNRSFRIFQRCSNNINSLVTTGDSEGCMGPAHTVVTEDEFKKIESLILNNTPIYQNNWVENVVWQKPTI